MSVLNIKNYLDAEIIHYKDDKFTITSRLNIVTLIYHGQFARKIVLPLSPLHRLIGQIRLVRRFFRTDKSSIALAKDFSSLVITYRGKIYRYDIAQNTLTCTGSLSHCKTVMHGSIASIHANTFIFGEYGSNPERNAVPIYMSSDGGATWDMPYLFPKGKIRHIHGVYWDKYTEHIWVCTGDFSGENFIYEFSDINFTEPKIYGDGSQMWRTVRLFFQKDKIVWGMDSELEPSRLVTLDRKTGKEKVTCSFPGPIWYTKQLSDEWYLLQTTVEKGAGVVSNDAHIYVSKDLERWHKIASFPSDVWPLGLFKNTVISFADGEQTIDRFFMSMEAVSGKDGKSFECSIDVSGDLCG